jgi:hypothetical protein
LTYINSFQKYAAERAAALKKMVPTE